MELAPAISPSCRAKMISSDVPLQGTLLGAVHIKIASCRKT